MQIRQFRCSHKSQLTAKVCKNLMLTLNFQIKSQCFGVKHFDNENPSYKPTVSTKTSDINQDPLSSPWSCLIRSLQSRHVFYPITYINQSPLQAYKFTVGANHQFRVCHEFKSWPRSVHFQTWIDLKIQNNYISENPEDINYIIIYCLVLTLSSDSPRTLQFH